MTRPALLTAMTALACTSALLVAAPTDADEPASASAQPAGDDRAAYAEGARLYEADRFKEAGEAFHRAFAIAKRPVYLFNAARAEQRALQLDAAERDFLRTLELEGVPDEMRQRISLHLDEIRTTRAELDRVGARATATPLRRTAGVVATVTGGVSVVVGAVVVGISLSDDNRQVADLGPQDADGRYVATDWASYRSRRDGIERNHRLGHALLWSGSAVIGGGLWLWLAGPATDAPAKASTAAVALLPAGRGMALQVAF